MPNPHYSPGDLVTFFTPLVPGGALHIGIVIRQVTDAEITDINTVGGEGVITSPAFWISRGDAVSAGIPPSTRVPGELPPYAAFPVEGSGIVTVIKASGDSDTIAGLLS